MYCSVVSSRGGTFDGHPPPGANGLLSYDGDSIFHDSITVEEWRLDQLIPLWVKDLCASHQPIMGREGPPIPLIAAQVLHLIGQGR